MANRSTTTVPELVRALSDFRTRAGARRALGALGPDACADALLRVAADPDATENARWGALDLLARFAHAPALPLCVNLLRHDPRLHGAALDTLRRISGADPGDDPDAWDRYLAGGGQAAAAGDIAPELALAREALSGDPVDISWEAPGYLHLQVKFNTGRHQQLVITFAKDPRAGEPAALFYTECGATTEIARLRDLIARRNVTLRHGRFFLDPASHGATKVSLRQTVPKRDLTSGVFRDLVFDLTREADSFEAELTGGDRI